MKRADTWWQQTADRLGAAILVNNSWSSSGIYRDYGNIPGAYKDRCVNLHDNTGDNAGEEPDMIFVYMGTNDFGNYRGSLGTYETADFEGLIRQEGDGFVYGQPATTIEAYGVMLHKIANRYPDAEVYCMNILARRNPNQDTQMDQALADAFSADLLRTAQRFGAIGVDLYEDCGISLKPGMVEDHKNVYLGDHYLHPSKTGMDAITSCVLSSVYSESKYRPADKAVHPIFYTLTNARVEEGLLTSVLDGEEFQCTLTGSGKVTVTMGGEDITEAVCTDGLIRIPAVTGRVEITGRIAPEPETTVYSYHFALNPERNGFQSVADDRYTANTLTPKQGMQGVPAGIKDGSFTNVYFQLEKPLVLKHDQPWTLEWKSTGSWYNPSSGALLFSEREDSAVANNRYIFLSGAARMLALGRFDGRQFNSYGMKFPDLGNEAHVFHLENRVSDGENTVYLTMDGGPQIPMTHYYVNSGTDKGTEFNFANGQDFIFRFLGTRSHYIGACSLEYITVTGAF